MHDLSLFDLSGRKALVTGSEVGIGRGCSKALSMAGAKMAIIDVYPQTTELAVREIRSLRREAEAFCCDVSDKTQVKAMAAAFIERFGHLDIVVSNAEISRYSNDIEQTMVNWDKVVSVNFTGVWLYACAEARQTKKRSGEGGKINNTASVAATIVSNGNDSYNAAKTGVVHLTHSLAAQWGVHNINVNCFSTSYPMTPNESCNSPKDIRKYIRDLTPLEHVQRPDDLFGSIIFLASGPSDNVTSHNLMVDGKHTLNTWLGSLKRSATPRFSPNEEIAAIGADMDGMSRANRH